MTKILAPVKNKIQNKHIKKLSLNQQATGHNSPVRTVHMSVHDRVQLWYTIQHRTVLIVTPLGVVPAAVL